MFFVPDGAQHNRIYVESDRLKQCERKVGKSTLIQADRDLPHQRNHTQASWAPDTEPSDLIKVYVSATQVLWMNIQAILVKR